MRKLIQNFLDFSVIDDIQLGNGVNTTIEIFFRGGTGSRYRVLGYHILFASLFSQSPSKGSCFHVNHEKFPKSEGGNLDW